MKYKIEIKCDNAVFNDDLVAEALIHALNKVIVRLAGQTKDEILGSPFNILDNNGNSIGKAFLTEGE